MKRWLKLGILGLLVAGALTAMLTGMALAQDDTPDPETNVWFGPGGPGHRKGFGPGLGSGVGLEAAAEALGMTPEELSTQLWGGKTLADLAEEKGVPLEDVKAAVEAAQEQAYRDSLAQAVEDGKITQEHADWLLEGLDKGFLGGFGRGWGGGFRGRFFGGFGKCPEVAPTTPSEGTDS